MLIGDEPQVMLYSAPPPSPEASMAQRGRTESAARFTRTRQDHRDETAEDYVEAVAELIARDGQARVGTLATQLGVSHVTVSRTVSRLAEAGYLRTLPYKPIELTAAGKRLAARARARHETVVRFLQAIGVPAADAEVDAEGIEHHVGAATLAAMRRHVKACR